jgi:hypothetical protein
MKAFLPQAFAAALALSATGAVAGELADLGATADTLAQQGQYLEALATLADAQDRVWQKSPLLFRKTVFVASDPAGFGIYDLHEGSTFKRSEPLILYAEPVGYGYRKDGELNVIDLSLDFEVKAKDGRPIGGQKAFANPQLRSRVQNHEFFVKVTYDFSKVPAGEYEVKTTVNDQTTGKAGSFMMPFTLTD